MKLTSINKDKFKTKNKYKLMVLTPLLCGVLLISGCTKLNDNKFYNSNDIYSSQSQTEKETKSYDVTIICSNTELLNERDLILVYDEKGDGRHAYYSSSDQIETNFDMNNSVITTKYLQDVKVKVELEENEKGYIYIDYLTKTITVEKELVLKK